MRSLIKKIALLAVALYGTSIAGAQSQKENDFVKTAMTFANGQWTEKDEASKLDKLQPAAAVKYVAKKANVISQSQSNALKDDRIISPDDKAVSNVLQIPAGYIIGIVESGKVVHVMISFGNGAAYGTDNLAKIGIGNNDKWESVRLPNLVKGDVYNSFSYRGKTFSLVCKSVDEILNTNSPKTVAAKPQGGNFNQTAGNRSNSQNKKNDTYSSAGLNVQDTVDYTGANFVDVKEIEKDHDAEVARRQNNRTANNNNSNYDDIDKATGQVKRNSSNTTANNNNSNYDDIDKATGQVKRNSSNTTANNNNSNYDDIDKATGQVKRNTNNKATNSSNNSNTGDYVELPLDANGRVINNQDSRTNNNNSNSAGNTNRQNSGAKNNNSNDYVELPLDANGRVINNKDSRSSNNNNSSNSGTNQRGTTRTIPPEPANQKPVTPAEPPMPKTNRTVPPEPANQYPTTPQEPPMPSQQNSQPVKKYPVPQPPKDNAAQSNPSDGYSSDGISFNPMMDIKNTGKYTVKDWSSYGDPANPNPALNQFAIFKQKKPLNSKIMNVVQYVTVAYNFKNDHPTAQEVKMPNGDLVIYEANINLLAVYDTEGKPKEMYCPASKEELFNKYQLKAN
ncbi:MAG: hypothetical protein V4685_12370 [Bacteroidota bacterium]